MERNVKFLNEIFKIRGMKEIGKKQNYQLYINASLLLEILHNFVATR